MRGSNLGCKIYSFVNNFDGLLVNIKIEFRRFEKKQLYDTVFTAEPQT